MIQKNQNKALFLGLFLTSLLSDRILSSAMALDQIVRPYQSVRSSAMGGVRYTTGLYDENFFGNPARTADNPTWRIDLLNFLAEINTGLKGNVSSVTKGGDKIDNVASTAGENNHLRVQAILPAVYIPQIFSSRNSIAIGLISSTQVDLSLRKNYSVDPSVISDLGPAVSYARRINERLHVGVTGHYIHRLATNETYSTIDYIQGKKLNAENAAGEGTAIDFDLGATHDVSWSPFGLDLKTAFAVNNVMKSKFKSGGIDFSKKVTALPKDQNRSFNAGFSLTKDLIFKTFSLTTAFEVTDVGNNPHGSLFRTLHLGGEMNFWDLISLRTGINQGYFCGGIGFDLPFLKLELSTYGEEMSLNAGGQEDRRYALKLGFAI